MQWRRIVEPDVIDSGDEAERSGEDSELEGDGGVRCCHHKRQHTVSGALLMDVPWLWFFLYVYTGNAPTSNKQPLWWAGGALLTLLLYVRCCHHPKRQCRRHSYEFSFNWSLLGGGEWGIACDTVTIGPTTWNCFEAIMCKLAVAG